MKWFYILLLFVLACSSPTERNFPKKEKKNKPKKSFYKKPTQKTQTPRTVILISIDGYRHDYTEIYNPPFLSTLASNGVFGHLRPVFPSYTFPNHYSIVTGLYAENHGLINNIFYDPAIKKEFSLANRATMNDSYWYGGEPIWVSAEKSGLKTASHFWVGSEASIKGIRPTYYIPFDSSIPNTDRVERVLDWLKLPIKERPSFITLYFGNVDKNGHKYGPLSPEVKAAVFDVDSALEKLITEGKQLNPNIQFIIVSDHGMEDLRKKEKVYLEDYIKKESMRFRFLGQGPIVQIYNLFNGDQKTLVKKLKKQFRYFYVYPKRSIPKKYHFKNSHRIPDVLLVAKKGYLIQRKRANPHTSLNIGGHGFDPTNHKNMLGVLYAHGTDFKTAYKLHRIDNIHIQPLIMHLLGLEQLEVDGKLSSIKRILKR